MGASAPPRGVLGQHPLWSEPGARVAQHPEGLRLDAAQPETLEITPSLRRQYDTCGLAP